MHILVLDYKDYWHAEAGGSQTYALAMIREFQRRGHEVTVFTCFSNRPRDETVDGVHYVREGTKFTVFHSAKVYLAKHGGEFDVVLDTVNQRPFLAHEIVGNKATALVYHLGLETWNSEFGFPFNVVGRKIFEPEWMRRLRSAPRVLAISASTANRSRVSASRVTASCRRPLAEAADVGPRPRCTAARPVHRSPGQQQATARRRSRLHTDARGVPGYLDGHRRRRLPHRPDP